MTRPWPRIPWSTRVLAATIVILGCALIPFFAPSLTDPLVRPLLTLLGDIGPVETRYSTTSDMHDPIKTVKEQQDPDKERPYQSYWKQFWINGRWTNLPPNYQLVSSFPDETAIARMARSVGRVNLLYANNTQAHCTGTLISDTHILTAAHCFYSDEDTGSFATWAGVKQITFDVGPYGKDRDQFIVLDVQSKPEEIFCPRSAGAQNCEAGPTDDYDFAILKILPDAQQSRKAKDWSMEEARRNGIRPVSLATLKVVPRHQMVLVHYPQGAGNKMVTERNCLGTENPPGPQALLVKHVCDTEGGSSGGALFSRDHEVMFAMHFSGEKLFNETERAQDTGVNHALSISAIASVSQIIGRTVEVLDHPPTAEQHLLIGYAQRRGEQARRVLEMDRPKELAARIALDGLTPMVGRVDAIELVERAQSTTAVLTRALIDKLQVSKRVLQKELPSAGVVFSQDRTRILATVSDGRVGIWSTTSTSKAPVFLQLPRENFRVSSALFSAEGSLLVTISTDGAAQIWRTSDGKLFTELQDISAGQRIPDLNTLAFSPDATKLITTSQDGASNLWDVKTGRLLKRLKHDDRIIAVAFSSDSRKAITASPDRTVRLWDATNGSEIGVIKGHKAGVTGVTISPDGMRLVTWSLDRTIRIWDMNAASQIWTIPTSSLVKNVRWGQDARTIFVTDLKNSIKVWNLNKPDNPPIIFRGHKAPVLSVEINAEGTKALTLSDDGVAYLWYTDSGDPITVFSSTGTSSMIVAGAVFSGNHEIMTVSGTGNVDRWPLPPEGLQLLQFSKEQIGQVALDTDDCLEFRLTCN